MPPPARTSRHATTMKIELVLLDELGVSVVELDAASAGVVVVSTVFSLPVHLVISSLHTGQAVSTFPAVHFVSQVQLFTVSLDAS